jgi:hypothetical protein
VKLLRGQPRHRNHLLHRRAELGVRATRRLELLYSRLHAAQHAHERFNIHARTAFADVRLCDEPPDNLAERDLLACADGNVERAGKRTRTDEGLNDAEVVPALRRECLVRDLERVRTDENGTAWGVVSASGECDDEVTGLEAALGTQSRRDRR